MIGSNLLRIYEGRVKEQELFSLEVPKDRQKTLNMCRMAAEKRR